MIFNCNICKDIDDYKIDLKSFNILNNRINEDNDNVCVNVAVSTEYLDPIIKDKTIEVLFSVKVVGLNAKEKGDNSKNNIKDRLNDMEKNMDLNNDELLFSIDILYTIIFKCNKKIKDEKKLLITSKKEFKKQILKVLKDRGKTYDYGRYASKYGFKFRRKRIRRKSKRK